ncbi:uncharacterized protein LOC116112544 [Pistacia vera]|uniref:uncharacterized protein LOC116112544 n=1 Tax=Pistacia vera TaxID=55513 RepID=UPI00126390EC|nr:uncharacterized protein LOC116112544 [Pistacia vera]
MPFGLKSSFPVSESLMKDFYSPSSTCLFYIDDILLFSKDEESHYVFFVTLLISYTLTIMLFEKKMQLGQTKIDFLGMMIADGMYDLHLILLMSSKILRCSHNQERITTILGNCQLHAQFYSQHFLSHYSLSYMLKKNPHSWSEKQTNAVKVLMQILPYTPVKIPSSRDESSDGCYDTHWGAMLFEQDDDKV